ncbi:MAG: pirin family protein [Gammaproteobacteria bacterium]|nr:pirin family protein [Gammaproteobacteria bacterium]
MIIKRAASDRGEASHGWLNSWHSFSFANYYDPAHMGVSALRVINDDKVIAGAGFGMHSHQDMEIISYVKKGTIEHKDSMGNTEQLPAGEFQLMSAGHGITHSEYNPSSSEALEFLQIWIQPDVYGIEPGYQQKLFKPENGLQLIASPDARNDSLLIHQNAFLYRILQSEQATVKHSLSPGRTVYLHVINGTITHDSVKLCAGDGATINNITDIALHCSQACEALLFDLP